MSWQYFLYHCEKDLADKLKHKAIPIILSMGTMGIVGAIEYVCMKNINFTSILIMLTLLVLGFESVSDFVVCTHIQYLYILRAVLF